MSKHTQGSWDYSKHGTPEAFPQFGVYSKDTPARDFAIVKGSTMDNAEANAQLIAAAPDLAEALRAVVDCADYCQSGPVTVGFALVLKRCVAALSKAGCA